MFSAFQWGFQAGFQVVYPPIANIAYNGNSTKPIRQEYQPTSYELQHIERLNAIEAAKLKSKVVGEDLRAKEREIEELELRRLQEGLADQLLQLQLLQLLQEQQQMIVMQLELERVIREIMEEDEALFVILMTMPL